MLYDDANVTTKNGEHAERFSQIVLLLVTKRHNNKVLTMIFP